MNTAHLKSLVIPPTQSKKLNKKLERLDAVRQGLIAGKSFRRIAHKLNCDEGTIRHDVKKLLLQVDDFQMYVQGCPYEQVKRNINKREWERRHQEQLERRRERLVLELKHGAISDELSVSILNFLNDLGFNLVTQLQVLIEATRESYGRGNIHNHRCYIEDHQASIFCNKPAGTQPADAIDLLNWQIKWLVDWLSSAELRWDIRDKAIAKARLKVENTPQPSVFHVAYAAERSKMGKEKPRCAFRLGRQGNRPIYFATCR